MGVNVHFNIFICSKFNTFDIVVTVAPPPPPNIFVQDIIISINIVDYMKCTCQLRNP